MAIKVYETNIHDCKKASEIIENFSYKFPRPAKIIADEGYRGNIADWVLRKFGGTLDVVLRSDEHLRLMLVETAEPLPDETSDL